MNDRSSSVSTKSEAGIRAAELTALLAGAPKPDEHEGVRKFVHALAAQGCAPLLIYPNAKKPFDGRTVCQRNADDQAAQLVARDAGRRNWQKIKSPSGVHSASDDTDVLDGYLDRYIGTFGGEIAVNVGISVGRSRLVVVDCDTSCQVAAFLADIGAPAGAVPTVRSPGQRDPRTGEMVHRDGGHFYFVVPEDIELPAEAESFTDANGGYAVFWGRGRCLLTPPSVRAEGAYIVPDRGVVRDLPEDLCERILEHGRARAERVARNRERARGNDDRITAWGASVTWAEILAGTDWSATGKADICGCDTWTAPGSHASEKSATAHEFGCAQFDSDDPCLHIWTDHDVEPFDRAVAEYGNHLTRLRGVAAIHYDNNIGAAMTAQDLHDDTELSGDPGTADDEEQAHGGVGAMNRGATTDGRRLQITWACEIVPEPVPWLWVDISAQNTWTPEAAGHSAPDPFRMPDIACVAPGHIWTPPEVESDGRIACGMVSIAAGREGSGKSSFGIWLTSKITRGTLPGSFYGTPRTVFYLATEDSWRYTLVPRLIAAGADMSKVARIEVLVKQGNTVTLSLPDDTELLTQEIIDHDVALVVVDPLMSTIRAGLDANGSRDVRTALEPLAAMADRTGAAVVGIAHFNKATGLDALSRITGSGAFKDIARAVMVFADDGNERVFTQPKNSVGRYDLPSLHYQIQSAIVNTPTGKASTGVFTFTRMSERSVDDILTDERGRKRRKSDVATFLIDYITDHADEQSREVDAAEVIAAGEAKGFKSKQITDARSRCTDPEISTRKQGFGKEARNLWKIER